MAIIETEVEEVELEGDYAPVPGLRVTCSKCGHSVEVFGTSEASARKAGVMLKEECGSQNFYVIDWDE